MGGVAKSKSFSTSGTLNTRWVSGRRVYSYVVETNDLSASTSAIRATPECDAPPTRLRDASGTDRIHLPHRPIDDDEDDYEMGLL